MKKLIFIGGFENTGSRILVNYLLKNGYKTIKPNSTMDYLGMDFLKLFDIYWYKNDSGPLIRAIKKDIQETNEDKIVIKHGHLNFLFGELKKEYPEAHFITCIRNPFDILAKKSHNYVRYARKNNPTIRDKFQFLQLWYTQKILDECNMVVRMEDFVFNPYAAFKSFDKLLDNNTNEKILNEFIKTIKPSKTIGNGKNITDNIDKIEQFAKMFNY